ncbi:helix-turn-helix domain-containing protein [Agilicoccus flavus]|uniref:helix-turn-helix domain-containing protein n=1 Tax=Agilicoccus flavus TaxID=2775968 RepID=UPI001CF63F73|nr:helix-turn-helix transcriptional regulator [Agilicoccus flavus]
MSNVVRLPVRPAAEPLWRVAVGDVVREERLDRGERLADVAGRAGVAPQYLSEIERGRKDPSSEVLGAVAGALDLTVGEVAHRAASLLRRGAVCLAA